MCSPTLAIMGVQAGLRIASGIARSRAQLAAGEAQQNYYNALAESNRQQGEAALRRGQKQSEVIQDVAKSKGSTLARRQARFSSSQRAALASAGVVGVTAEDIAKDTFNEQRLDELTLRYNADIQSYGAVTDATFRNHAAQVQANQNVFAGKQARFAARTRANATILGTAFSVGSTLFGGVFKSATPSFGPFGGTQTSTGPVSFLPPR